MMLALLPIFASIQITITQSDFPTAGITFINTKGQKYKAHLPEGGPAQT